MNFFCLSLNFIKVLKIIWCLDWKIIFYFESVNKGMFVLIKGVFIEELVIVE